MYSFFRLVIFSLLVTGVWLEDKLFLKICISLIFIIFEFYSSFFSRINKQIQLLDEINNKQTELIKENHKMILRQNEFIRKSLTFFKR